jgi:hypothetical protein
MIVNMEHFIKPLRSALGRNGLNLGLSVKLTTVFTTAWLLAASPLLGAVLINVSVSTSPTPTVTFSWSGSRTAVVERRLLGQILETDWVEVGRATNTTSFVNTVPATGQSYEYRLIFTLPTPVDIVPVAVSFDAPLEDQRGGVILVVDNAIKDELAGDITRFEMDLVGDGWQVKRINFDSHGTGTGPALKAAIQTAVLENPAINSLFLFGNVPVVSSGFLAPDGHSARAHETDTYYADLDGTWTDASTFGTNNIPGDGQFDQSSYPTTLELATGRVVFDTQNKLRKLSPDMSRDYLHKNHAWRQGQRVVSYRASLDTFYHGPWHNWGNAIFGTTNTLTTGFSGTRTTPSILSTTRGSASTFINNLNDVKAIFTSNFQSYRQEWYDPANPNMSALGLPDWALTACWGGRPGIFLHQIAGGKTIGYSFLQSQNDLRRSSSTRSYYDATIDSSYYGFAEYFYGPGVHVNLQGDPTLRMHPVLPVKGLTAVKNGGEVQLAWTASQAPNLQGYHVYRSTDRLGVYTRLTSTPVTGTQYTDAAAPAAIDTYYQVRAIAREIRPTGTYFNQSQGAFALVKANGSANRSPVAQAGTLRAKRNSPTPFTYPGSDADGDSLTPIILNNPQNGYLRWWNGRPYYISNNNYTGSDTITFAMSDGVAVSEPAIMTVNVDEVGENILLAWDFTDGSSVPGSTWNDPNIQPATVSWSQITGISNSFPNKDQYSFRFIEPLTSILALRFVPFTVTPQPGRKVSLDEIRFALNGTTPAIFTLELRASTDNFATSVQLPLSPGNTFTGRGIQRHNYGVIYEADASGVPALQNVAGPVQFRLFIWRTGGDSNTTISLGKITDTDGAPDAVEDIVITGQVSKIDGAPNQAPASTADAYSTYLNTPLVVAAAQGVLANDTDVDGDGLLAFVVTPPANGTLALGTNGGFTYTPTTGYTGPDSFTYRVSDGKAYSAPATVSLQVLSPAPAITSTPVTTAMANEPYTATVTATGLPAPTFSLTTFPAGMTIHSTSGVITWTPAAAGHFNVTVQAENGVGVPATQSFSITVASGESPYVSWKSNKFSAEQLGDPEISGDLADYDRDGFNTLTEFFMGGDPLIYERLGATAGMTASNQLTITFNRHLDAQDFLFVVEGTSNLHANDWATTGIVLDSTTPISGGREQLTFRDTIGGLMRFLRLRVIGPPPEP